MKKLAFIALFTIFAGVLNAQNYLAPVKSGSMWGYIDMEGNWVIKPQFTSAWRFYSGFARIERGDNAFYIDKTGEIKAVNKSYKVIRNFKNGYARVKVRKKIGFIDTTLNLVIEAAYDEAKYFSEGLFPVQLNKLWGYIDINSNWVIEPTYEKAYSFHGGVAMVRIEEVWYFIDKEGKELTNPVNYRVVKKFSDGLTKVQKGEKWGYIDENFRIVIPPEFDAGKDYTEGVISVKSGDKWGYIDRNGNWLQEPLFDKAYEFHDGMAMAKIKKTWYYIDKNFQIIDWTRKTEPTNSFSNGLARIKIKGYWGFIDIHGNFVVKPIFNSVHDFTKFNE